MCFLEKMPYLHAFSEKTAPYIFLKFWHNVKVIGLQILSKFQKNCWSGFPLKSQKPQKRVFFKKKERFSRNWGTKLKKRLGHFLSPIGPLLHAKFQKNRWSGFRETAVTNGRTDERTNGRTDERTDERRWFYRTLRFSTGDQKVYFLCWK